MTSSNPYGHRTNGGGHGDVFTSPDVVKFMLDLVGYSPRLNLSQFKILEPSCGEGEFIVEIASRLIESSKIHQFNANEAFNCCVYAYDIDSQKISRLKKRILSLGLNAEFANIFIQDFLSSDIPMVDIVIGNPPYVRYENIPEDDKLFYKSHFNSFHYRADLYIPFFEKSLKLLKPGGKHCFICSNRWLKNEYGKKLRSLIAHQFRLNSIINLEKADAFQEKVLAYPAITLISNQLRVDTIDYANVESISRLENIKKVHKQMPLSDDWNCLFCDTTSNSNLYTIEELGFKIGIGVATGADRIFISKQLPDEVELELLLPAINARNLRGDSLQWNGEFLLNPYQSNGSLINLTDYPKASLYLEKHKDTLSKRHIVQRNASRWYKTIDRIYPNLLHEAKILLPDMSSNRYIFVDEGNYYPLHNLYYITGQTTNDLKVLGALLISDSIRQQICGITNNMNGGFPRWQSQYLRKLRIPNILEISEDERKMLIHNYEQRNYNEINKQVQQLFERSTTKKRLHRHALQSLSIPFEYAENY